MKKENKKISQETYNNSYYDYATGGLGNIRRDIATPLETLIQNLDFTLLTVNRSLISSLYTKDGLMKKIVNTPVEDAFRGGIEIRCAELGEDAKTLQDKINNVDLKQVKLAAMWSRAFGGSGLIIDDGSLKGERAFNINNIKQGSFLEFRAADLWELSIMGDSQQGLDKPYSLLPYNTEFYSYYYIRLHQSRVFKVKGEEACSIFQPMLRHWGLSVIESLGEAYQELLKAYRGALELLDEMKIDVYKIMGFNETIKHGGGKAMLDKIGLVNLAKGIHKSIAMDSLDGFEQRQMNFSGIPEMLSKAEARFAATVGFPISKLMGYSASGFSSGEDVVEEYNGMIESQVRGKFNDMILQVAKIRCMQMFGFIPTDISIEYKALRVLNAEQEENIKDKKLLRVVSLYDRGLITSKNVMDCINKDNLLPIILEEMPTEDFPLSPTQLGIMESEKALRQKELRNNNILSKIFRK